MAASELFFAKTLNGWKLLAIFAEISIVDVSQGAKYSYAFGFFMIEKLSA